MSAWWLILIIPLATMIGVTVAAMFNAHSYDKGYSDGWTHATRLTQEDT